MPPRSGAPVRLREFLDGRDAFIRVEDSCSMSGLEGDRRVGYEEVRDERDNLNSSGELFCSLLEALKGSHAASKVWFLGMAEDTETRCDGLLRTVVTKVTERVKTVDSMQVIPFGMSTVKKE